jgi:hypothetical protein
VEAFKLESVREALARAGSTCEPRTRGTASEFWGRRVGDRTFIASLVFDPGKQIVYEATLRATLRALDLGEEEVLRAIRVAGGTYLGPLP